MHRLLSFLGALAAVALLAQPGTAQPLTALARVDASASSIRDVEDLLVLDLALSQAVPYRVFTLDDPRRLVLDFSEVAWDSLDPAAFDRSDRVRDVVMGQFRPGWSRMVLTLEAPLALDEAGMSTAGDGAEVRVVLRTVSAGAFAAASGTPDSARFRLPDPAAGLVPPRRRQSGSRPVMVVLDPGHGGIDPGAVRDDLVEADLMLTFARELKELLLRSGGFDVMLTRDDDIFVPLEMRLSIARAAGADVFLSLHADALAEGRAHGATVYTLSETASDVASEKLAERHDRADLLAGVDLSGQDDAVALVLMDMVRAETAPRAGRLAEAIVAGLGEKVGDLHKRPLMSASFSVLKAADIPSVLVELGFLSSQKDREKLTDPAWRAKAAEGIRDALAAWAREDAAEAALLRQ